MKINISVEIQPFATPNFVLPTPNISSNSEGFKEVRGIPLKDIDVATLDKLCSKFREDVFRKAGKTKPPL